MEKRYLESEDFAHAYRKNYLDGLTSLIQRKQLEKKQERIDKFTQKLENIEQARYEFKKMLGWPLVGGDNHKPSMRLEYVGKDDEAFIYRAVIDVFADYAFYGLLFLRGDTSKEPDLDKIEKKPLIISQHGGLGTAELCSGMYGNSENYNDMTYRLLKHDVHVFAPQMLLWNAERFHLPFDRVNIDRDLKQIGSSITAVEVYSLQKTLDILCEKPYVDADRIGMAGLSYGGFYTLFAAACDTRIKSCISCSFFNDRIKYNWTDWTWFDSAGQFLDAETAALIAPRYIEIQIGTHDELFDCDAAQETIEQTKQYFNMLHCPEKLKINVFEGLHEFYKDDASIKEMIAHLEDNLPASEKE